MTVVLVEQHPRLNLMLASYVYFLGSGEPVLQGKTSDLMLNEGVKKAHLGV
jgi:ABC-type branched-subunit amino acid transport system ATPase component